MHLTSSCYLKFFWAFSIDCFRPPFFFFLSLLLPRFLPLWLLSLSLFFTFICFTTSKMKFLGQRSLLAATTVAFSILRSVGAEDASDVLNLTQDTFASTVDAEVINDRRAVERRRVDTDEFFPTFSR